MALHAQGARLRVFADPMQKVFSEKTLHGSCPPCDWDDLKGKAHACEELDVPHRWADGCPALGEWTLQARKTLKAGGILDLHGGLPESVSVVIAENLAQKNREYALSKQHRKPVDAFQHDQPSLLILTRHNQTGRSFRGFFNRSIPLWEGHTRSGLDRLVDALIAGRDDHAALAAAAVKFMDDVGKGFSPSAFGNAFQQEVAEGCTKSRKGKPARIQELARCLLAEPDHHGVARMLRRVSELKAVDPAFAEIEMDCHKEFWDAIKLGDFESVDVGLAEITHRRTYARPKPPDRAISTIHKAKGLECDSVIIMPCDATSFPNKQDARCLLYVALSRAKKRLLLVVSRDKPSPLFSL